MKRIQKSSGVCIVVPMFNEEAIAAASVTAIIKVMKQVSLRIHLIVVNDGSTDATRSILEKEEQRFSPWLTVVSHSKNRGYGSALRTGIKTAAIYGYEWVLFMDSDLTNDPRDIPRFIDCIGPEIDCVKASRYTKGGGMVGVPIYRQLCSRLGNRIASVCFRLGIKDCTNGFRMVRTEALTKIALHEQKFAIIVEELYELKKRHARCVSLPVVLTNRKTATSHFQYSLSTFVSYAKYVIKAATLN